jgi:hypothetical protein
VEDRHLKPKTRSLKLWLAIAVTASLSARLGFVVGSRVPSDTRSNSIPFAFLARTVPVQLRIEFTGKSTEVAKWNSGEPFYEATGVARYTFTNWTSSPIQLAFPPARSFQFSRRSMSAAEPPPSFASKAFVLKLAAGESKSFTEPYSLAPAGDEFWEGGPGLRAFTFQAPSVDPKGDYCVGTVFGHYTASKETP